ncbi:nucleoside triphosphate pyrophosphohydrolase [candidate division LCP-89 bacterium B3_LCP]|uniref:Nucleoside triphosphate pyrophosphohydrolase n=1 Tax=candidate division LCP-89 bacterium B3_LCP TaxID=2012998 RepID=A0A532UTX5_UNCL8|nr:MAG: nucleoside triphosphate pyrophosphohydrolase [candidate division LCP-89 bacterium B3_LCP]
MKPDPFRELVAILEKLRSPEGCPWDREQTFDSLRPYFLEEAYEILQAIDDGKYAQLEEELGDLLMHIVFQAQIAREQDLFTIDDVLRSINRKLIRRHPHVFGEGKVENSKEVLENWEKIKLDEGPKRLLGGVPKNLPALLRAFRVQEKAAGVGFDWAEDKQVITKILEEIKELRAAKTSGDREKITEEFGDLLFSMVNLARFWGVSPEESLRGTVEKFTRRFSYIEDALSKQGRNVKDSTLEEMDVLWEEAKRKGM